MNRFAEGLEMLLGSVEILGLYGGRPSPQECTVLGPLVLPGGSGMGPQASRGAAASAEPGRVIPGFALACSPPRVAWAALGNACQNSV